MGLQRTAGQRNNMSQRLAIVAGDLEPKRAPFWVSQPGGNTPSQGWWWVPKGATHPSFLGHNYIVAEVALRQLVDAQYAA